MRAEDSRRDDPVEAGRRKFRLDVVLSLAIGGLVFVSLAIVLAVLLASAVSTTRSLVVERARLILDAIVYPLVAEIEPAEEVTAFIAQQVALGALDINDQEAVATAFTFALGGLPQLSALVLLRPDGRYFSIFPIDDGAFDSETASWLEYPAMVRGYQRLRNGGASGADGWNDPLFVEAAGTTLVNYGRPLIVDGAFLGGVVATLRVDEMSRMLEAIAPSLGGHPFVLFGREHVLAHAAIAHGDVALDKMQPLPRLDEVGDVVLAAIWMPGWEERGLGDFAGAHGVQLDGKSYYFLYRTVGADSARPIYVGAWFREGTITGELDRLRLAALIGLGALLLSILAAIALARSLARPAHRVSSAADRIRALDLDPLPSIRRSRIREVDSAAQAFNAMAASVAAFARYVPRQLVENLIRSGSARRFPLREQELTIMFTDIVGFTRLSEGLAASEVAELVNTHFALLTRHIEAEGGIVDKYLGDGLMAFFGVPGIQPDHSDRAVRAALAIADELEAGPPATPRIRIGIHRGVVLVGDVGGASRVNFTLVGLAANLAERLQEAGRGRDKERHVVIMVSDVVLRHLTVPVVAVAVEGIVMRGVTEPLPVYELRREVAPC